MFDRHQSRLGRVQAWERTPDDGSLDRLLVSLDPGAAEAGDAPDDVLEIPADRVTALRRDSVRVDLTLSEVATSSAGRG